MSATLRDVADKAALSKSLVSLALRGDDGVSIESRRAAVDAAVSLGHPVGALARRRAEGGPLLLAALLTERANPFHAEVLVGVQETARSLGFEVRIVDGRRDPARLERLVASLGANAEDGQADLGAIVVSSWPSRPTLGAAAARLPVAVVGSAGESLRGLGLDTVRAAEEEGMRELVLHLHAVGDGRSCFVAESDRPSTTRRAHSYRHTIELLHPGEPTRSETIDALEADPSRLLRLVEEGVEAFVAANDPTAARLRILLSNHHREGAAALSGFDNSALAGRLGLTSVDQPRERLGARAVELVAERLRGRRAERHEVLPTRLVVRRSTSRWRDQATYPGTPSVALAAR